ncbi:hypothetical protein HYPSUDRAFT_1054145 [Hypholoma sublateritium FD-334 SS-4]|uniref:Uncharacterized protein n=1 Tax=Hypholoma sublateritium (strain FD-334 SS-4) TaxID=945553 RepID=A0A0D2P978_HYPSF|nr:hypothetical protein HYPSUDRAFT_1054145 [Hypholoma sublateritium FD-334 SS-4]
MHPAVRLPRLPPPAACRSRARVEATHRRRCWLPIGWRGARSLHLPSPPSRTTPLTVRRTLHGTFSCAPCSTHAVRALTSRLTLNSRFVRMHMTLIRRGAHRPRLDPEYLFRSQSSSSHHLPPIICPRPPSACTPPFITLTASGRRSRALSRVSTHRRRCWPLREWFGARSFHAPPPSFPRTRSLAVCHPLVQAASVCAPRIRDAVCALPSWVVVPPRGR